MIFIYFNDLLIVDNFYIPNLSYSFYFCYISIFPFIIIFKFKSIYIKKRKNKIFNLYYKNIYNDNYYNLL